MNLYMVDPCTQTWLSKWSLSNAGTKSFSSAPGRKSLSLHNPAQLSTSPTQPNCELLEFWLDFIQLSPTGSYILENIISNYFVSKVNSIWLYTRKQYFWWLEVSLLQQQSKTNCVSQHLFLEMCVQTQSKMKRLVFLWSPWEWQALCLDGSSLPYW